MYFSWLIVLGIRFTTVFLTGLVKASVLLGFFANFNDLCFFDNCILL